MAVIWITLFFKTVQGIVLQICNVSPNAEWYLYGLKVLFSTPITSQHLPDTAAFLTRRVANMFGYVFFRGSILMGLENSKIEAEADFKKIEEVFGTPENEASELYTLVDNLGRLRHLPDSRQMSRLRALAVLCKLPQNLGTLRQIMRLYLDKQDAKDALEAIGSPGLARLINEVDALFAKTTVDNLRSCLGIYHYLFEKLDQKQADMRDVFRLLGIYESAGRFPKVLTTCIHSWETLFNFYFERQGQGNFEGLPDLLQGLAENDLAIPILFPNVLGVLTEPDMPLVERVAKVRRMSAEYTLALMGYPPSIANIWDAVSAESLFKSVANKKTISDRIHEPVVKNALSKGGAKGLQSYWESQIPPYYVKFRHDTDGISEDFFAPGEKFRFAYLRASASRADDEAVAPVTNPVRTMKELVKELRWAHQNLYDNFIAPKRELLKGKPLEEFIDEQSVQIVAKQFCAHLQDWEIPNLKKTEMVLKVLGVLFHPELSPHFKEAAGESKEEQLARYWSDFLNFIKGKGYIRKDSKLQKALQDEVKKRLFTLVSDQTKSREGVIQVMLTRGSLSDFFRGEISRDCTQKGDAKFNDTIGLPADPAFLAFKFVENGRWIGNVYSMLFKTTADTTYAKKGDYVVYIDQVAIDPKAALGYRGNEFIPERELFAKRFFEGMSQFLALNGIRFMMLANDPSVLDHMRSALVGEISARKWPTEALNVLKPGGMGHQTDLGVSDEYIQAIGPIREQMSVSGFLVELNMEDARAAEIQRRATEFKTIITIRRRDLDRTIQEVVRIEDEMTRLGKTIELYRQRDRAYTVTVLQKALNKMRGEGLALQGQADAISHEIETMETRMNGTSRSEVRFPTDRLPIDSRSVETSRFGEPAAGSARSETRVSEDQGAGSQGGEPFAYSLEMTRLRNQVTVSRARLIKIQEELTLLRTALERVNKEPQLAVPAIPEAAEPESKEDRVSETKASEKWWQDFLAGKVTRMEIKPVKVLRVKPKATMTPEEIRFKIEQLEPQERLLQENLTHHEQALQVAEQWLASSDRNAEESPFTQALNAEQMIDRIIQLVPPVVWEQLNRRFPDQHDRAFNLRPEDVVKQWMVAQERSDYFGKVLAVLDENGSFNRWFLQQESYRAFKASAQTFGLIPEFDWPGEWIHFQIPSDPADYSLVLAERDAEYLLRGFVSGDCTNCGPFYNVSSFLTATAVHIADPGILNFKLMKNGEWIGNIYAVVMQDGAKPVLVVDAIQIPWQGDFWESGASPLYFPFDLAQTRFPVKKSREAIRIAAGALLGLARYAETAHFQEVWLSSFISNFHKIEDYFSGALKPEIWDRHVTEDQKIGKWDVLETLGFQGKPYVESMRNPAARVLWPYPVREAQLARISVSARSELRILPGIGIRVSDQNRPLLQQAIDDGKKSAPADLKEYLTEVLSAFGLDQDLQYPGLLQLLNHTKFQLVTVTPSNETRGPPSPGLGLDKQDGSQDVYTAVGIEYGEGKQEEPTTTIYVGHGTYELATDLQRMGMVLHSFYLAYRHLNETDSDKYPVEIDLERLIDQRIRETVHEPAQGELEKAKFPGFENGAADRTDLLVRALAFSKLFTMPAGQTSEDALAGLLGTVTGLAEKFSKAGLFSYAEASVADMLESDKIERLMTISEYVGEHRRQEIGEFLDEKIQNGKDIIVLNTGAPSPLILTDVRKIIEHLAEGNRLRSLHLDLSPSLQPALDEFLRNGKMTPELLRGIAGRFPPFLPKEFSRPDLYESILRAVYTRNQDAPGDAKIRVYASYQPPVFPQGMPVDLEGGELPDFWKMELPAHFELPPEVQEPALNLSALLEKEARPGEVTLVINPMENFLPPELSERPRVASILHIDRYTGFGPEKEVNQLAFFMSEGGGTKHSFALPVYQHAPFYQESIQPGVPEGMPFNVFRSYRELIMSTADEDDGQEQTEPTPLTPDTEPRSPELVPVGGPKLRSEVRNDEKIPEAGLALNRREFLRGLAAIIAEMSTASDQLLIHAGKLVVEPAATQSVPPLSEYAREMFALPADSYINLSGFEGQIHQIEWLRQRTEKPESAKPEDMVFSKDVILKIAPGLQKSIEDASQMIEKLAKPGPRASIIAGLRQKIRAFKEDQKGPDGERWSDESLDAALDELVNASDSQLEELIVECIKKMAEFWKADAGEEGRLLQEAIRVAEEYQAKQSLPKNAGQAGKPIAGIPPAAEAPDNITKPHTAEAEAKSGQTQNQSLVLVPIPINFRESEIGAILVNHLRKKSKTRIEPGFDERATSAPYRYAVALGVDPKEAESVIDQIRKEHPQLTFPLVNDLRDVWSGSWEKNAFRKQSLVQQVQGLYLARSFYRPAEARYQALGERIDKIFIQARMEDYERRNLPPPVIEKLNNIFTGSSRPQTPIPAYLVTPSHIKDFGKVPAVILIHDAIGSKEFPWFDLLEVLLVKQGMAVVRIDLPGHGESQQTIRDVRGLEGDLEAVVRYLGEDPGAKKKIDAGRLGVVGFSLGGYVALRAAAGDSLKEKLSAVVSVNPAARPFFLDRPKYTAMKPYLGPMFSKGPEVPDTAIEGLAPDGKTFAGMKATDVEKLLIYTSALDRVVRPDAEWYRENIPGVPIKEIPASGHYPLGARKAALFQDIVRFLSGRFAHPTGVSRSEVRGKTPPVSVQRKIQIIAKDGLHQAPATVAGAFAVKLLEQRFEIETYLVRDGKLQPATGVLDFLELAESKEITIELHGSDSRVLEKALNVFSDIVNADWMGRGFALQETTAMQIVENRCLREFEVQIARSEVREQNRPVTSDQRPEQNALSLKSQVSSLGSGERSEVREEIKWPEAVQFLTGHPFQNIRDLSQYVQDLFKIAKKFDQIPYATYFMGKAKKEKYPDDTAWSDWLDHDMAQPIRAIRDFAEGIEDLWINKTGDKISRQMLTKWLRYLWKQHDEFMMFYGLLSGMARRIRSGEVKKEWAPETGTDAGRLERSDLPGWFLFKVFTIHKNAAANTKIFLEMVHRLDEAVPELERLITETKTWAVQHNIPVSASVESRSEARTLDPNLLRILLEDIERQLLEIVITEEEGKRQILRNDGTLSVGASYERLGRVAKIGIVLDPEKQTARIAGSADLLVGRGGLQVRALDASGNEMEEIKIAQARFQINQEV